MLDLTSDVRGWLFCLAFMSIGLESSLRDLARHTAGGRPIQLYVTGQVFNVVLTLAAAYLAFGGILFDRVSLAETARAAAPAAAAVERPARHRPRRDTPVSHRDRRLAGLSSPAPSLMRVRPGGARGLPGWRVLGGASPGLRSRGISRRRDSQGAGQRARRRWKYSTWNSRTLRLCSRRVSAKAWVPSLRLTK